MSVIKCGACGHFHGHGDVHHCLFADPPPPDAEALRAALERIKAVLTGAEINPVNYDDLDVARLSDSNVEAWQIAEAALLSRPRAKIDNGFPVALDEPEPAPAPGAEEVAREKPYKELLRYVQIMAEQRLSTEVSPEELEDAGWVNGWDTAINDARARLRAWAGGRKG